MAKCGMRTLLTCLFLAILPAAAEDEKEKAIDDPTRQHLAFFGAIIYADEINPLTGDARGRVYVDGTALNKEEPKFPASVRAESLKIDLENGKITLKGWPKLVWPGATLTSKDAKTVITLERTKYHVEGAASY
ncbi:MAG: hypothetical protein ACI8UO_005570, partial [Verrucomicrobiales bacterium]